MYASIQSEERTLPGGLELFGGNYISFTSDCSHERSRPEYLPDIPKPEAPAEIFDAAK